MPPLSSISSASSSAQNSARLAHRPNASIRLTITSTMSRGFVAWRAKHNVHADPLRGVAWLIAAAKRPHVIDQM